MPGLVEEIQSDALDQTVKVSSLLRRVKLAAAKLNLETVEEWVEHELKGYNGPVPEYRILSGRPVWSNHYNGWRPVGGWVQQISRKAAGSSIGELEDLVERGKHGFYMPYSDEISAKLNEMNQDNSIYALEIDRSQFVGIIDTVRNLVLEWAIDLEKNGIIGSGLSFKPEEIERAHSPMTINIGSIDNFAGNLGQGNSSGDITQNVANWSDVRKFADQVGDSIEALGRDGADTISLSTAVADLKAEVAKPDPDKSVVRGLLTDVRNAVSGAAGSLIASGIVAQVATFLGS